MVCGFFFFQLHQHHYGGGFPSSLQPSLGLNLKPKISPSLSILDLCLPTLNRKIHSPIYKLRLPYTSREPQNDDMGVKVLTDLPNTEAVVACELKKQHMSKCVQNREQVLGPCFCVLGVLRLCEHVSVYVSNLHRNQSHKMCMCVCVCECECECDKEMLWKERVRKEGKGFWYTHLMYSLCFYF